jgi:hypothetical protein
MIMLVELSTLVFSQAHLFPQAFWDTHRAARLSAVGEKGRPVACGDIFRRIWGGLVCRVVRSKAAPRFSRAGQVGVGVSGGVEIVSTTAQLVHEAGGVILSIDSVNAFNAVDRCAVLREVAAHCPAIYDYVASIYGADTDPLLLF